MSLKSMHILLISLVSLLCFFFGSWLMAPHGADSFLGGLLSFVLGFALIGYVIWFAKKIRSRDEEDKRRRKIIHPLAVAAGMLLTSSLGSNEVMACNVCYGEAGGPLIDAAKLGVYMLFGLVVLMQIAFAIFFLVLRHRAKAYEERRLPGRRRTGDAIP